MEDPAYLVVAEVGLAQAHQHAGFQVRRVEDKPRWVVGQVLQRLVAEQMPSVRRGDLIRDRRAGTQRSG
jgi:hypothetical protein